MRFLQALLMSMLLIGPTAVFAFEENPTPHFLPLDLTTEEYHQLWQHHLASLGTKALDDLEPATREGINGGEKLSLWLKKINQTRSPERQIRLTSPGTRSGIPIDSPSIYGPKQISESLAKMKSTLPAELTQVVYGTTDITATFPGTEEEFIKHARQVDRLYQTATRWATSIKPWLSWYRSAQARDVRGYYYLNKIADVDSKLQNFAQLPLEEQNALKRNLVGICRNARHTQSECEQSFVGSRSNNQVLGFKNRYWANAINAWNTFFKISNPRQDVDWTAVNAQRLSIEFRDPSNNRIRDFLKDNIEDEFKFGDWRLEMSFTNGGSGTAYLEFQPNVTPHVTGGNVIVMDANAPIEEYEVAWTIRHEYGHILRLPDCYVEFYDDTIESVVNYQLDTTDLMCSRAGNMNERIYLELKHAYFR
ncbi:MAG: hypothetical protein A2X86_07650 [Bdellovibrionales bacterium GWA2_49_15]|nr:MAG: hypothetical protein A2X86_07650 [Bdellovibrionales bacterium GWA2_49_15]HAZ11848.1 hypothetical protein [Bdellovibrionales bacterium]